MKRKKISTKLFIMTVCCMFICTAVFAFLYYGVNAENEGKNETIYENIIIELNGINHRIDALVSEDGDKASGESVSTELSEIHEKIKELMTGINSGDIDYNDISKERLLVFYIITMVFICLVFLIVYLVILRPFEKLEEFSSELSKGNFDMDLKYERANMFGEFTWAFDHMRSELKKSKEREQEAVENNKTIIATLSHDIKTPVASIRAYAEGLSDNMDSSPERRKRYLDVIMKKCDEVSKVTDDMFVHSLHDLDRLVICKDKIGLEKVIIDAVSSMSGDGNDLRINGNLDKFVLEEGDSQRISQVIENIITNARKYAEGAVIEVWSRLEEAETGKYYELHIKDNGPGIPPEDMPFIFDKFYRGKNKGDKNGAGLGLFIVKYIMEAMGGSVELNNSRNGLEVILTFRNEGEI